ncbi:MAG TPA: Gfo/Idh/MocA family oxidoreductase [Myxococcota bacterium]|nr:Gfo/Idh/MocA family oxidoreductase [Myxococcota bacterium]
MEARPLRIGILGAATIAPMALVRPAKQVPEAEVVAIAARNPERAARFSKRHGIPRVHASYDALLADPELDAVYNPLPNGLHCEWTLRALAAGKHVLCEKPLASNAEEAQRMAEAAERANRVLIEAFHWRHHPLAARMREILRAGEIGEVRHVEASTCIPLLVPGNIRFRYDLAGGALMDIGAYALNMVRWLAEAEPEVVSARAKLASPNVDRWLSAELRFADGRTGRVTCSLLSTTLLKLQNKVEGSRGRLRVFNPLAPHFYHRLTVEAEGERRHERVPGDATYTHQLRHFVARVRGAPPGPTEASDGIANMRAIDAIYRAAGLPPRGT